MLAGRVLSTLLLLGAMFTALMPYAYAEPLFVIRSDNTLVRIDSDAPRTVLSTVTITGLPDPTSRVKAIDFRPANSTLYALVRRTDQVGSEYSLHTINLLSGVSTQVGTLTFALSSGAETDVGMDFNPTVDRIRVVTPADENLRLVPDTGAVVTNDTPLAYDAADPNNAANPAVSCIAYDNNAVGVTSSTIFGIDRELGNIVRIGGVAGTPSPNAGILTTVGSTFVTSILTCGADFSNLSGSFYSVLSTGTESSFVSNLYRVGPSGLATVAGTFTDPVQVTDMAVPIFEANLPTITVDETPSRTTVRRPIITGTASDDTLVDTVLYRRGAGLEWQNVPSTPTWSRRVSLRPGRNRLQFKVRDIFGNESPVQIITIRKVLG